MAGEGGIGTIWCLGTAIEHIARIEAHELEQEWYRLVYRDDSITLGAHRAEDGRKRSPTHRSIDGLLLALRDGYVRATGRRSAIKRQCPTAETDTWRLHSSDPTLITTEEWRSGEFDADALVLTGSAFQYIQIEVPEFMVKAIWPDWPPCDVPAAVCERDAPAYTTPYLDLMQAAISRFGLTADCQSKKENLSDWFFEQTVEGEPISRNLANAMATLIRLPSAQRGGAKRI